ncbi:MAG: putative S-layer protein [Candidatus Pacearchaeota archaeon]
MMDLKSLKFFNLSIFTFLTLIFIISTVSALTLAEWPLTVSGNALNVPANVNAGVFISSPTINNFVFGNSGAEGENWSTSSSIDDNKYFEVNISPQTGNFLIISDISFNYSGSTISNNGSFELKYSKISGFGSPTSITIKTDVNNVEKISSNNNLNIIVNSGETLTLRWFGYNFSSPTNKFRIKSLNIQGTVIPTFCRNGPQNKSDLNLEVDIKNRGEGNTNEWLPLDRIEVQVRLRNDKTTDLRDVIFKLGLREADRPTVDVAGDMLWISSDGEEYEVGDVDSGDSSSKYSFEFRVNPNEVKFDKDYELVVKAYPDGKESLTCIDFLERVRIESEGRKDKMVVVDNYDFVNNPITAQCKQDVVLMVDVYNIGDRNFENKIKVRLFNSELGLNLENEIMGDLDSGDKAVATFNFKIPSNVTEKKYTLLMETEYDYRESTGTYRERSSKGFEIPLIVKGGCFTQPQFKISASLMSGGKAGEDLVVKVLTTNLGSSLKTYTFSSSGHNSWASEYNVEPTILVLGAGQSGEVIYTFKVNKGVSGEQSFFIEVKSENEITRQEVSVNIEKPTGFFGISGLAISENAGLWALGILNVVIIIVIIFVAVRLAKRK